MDVSISCKNKTTAHNNGLTLSMQSLSTTISER